MARRSPEAQELYVERRTADRHGKRAERRHARKVQTWERVTAERSYRAEIGVSA